MTHTRLPDDELAVFDSLKDIEVVFDVGARDDVDYLILKPQIELHAFEPNPTFFKELQTNVGERSNVHLNNFGLGDVEGEFSYNNTSQAIEGDGADKVKVKTLDSYVKEHNINRIDFLKIDTEGFELKVLRGGNNALKLCRYIQYEIGRSDAPIHEILKELGFELDYIGYSNMFCTRKGEEKPTLPETIHEGGLGMKTAKNYL